MKRLRSFYMKFNGHTFLLICMLWLAPQVSGQRQKIHFTRLSSRDGLFSHTLYTVLKDHYGLMWFAVAGGPGRFDGTSFTVYRHKPDDMAGLQPEQAHGHEQKLPVPEVAGADRHEPGRIHPFRETG